MGKKQETYATLKTREELHLEQKNTTAETESRTKAEMLCVGCYVASGSVRCGARGRSVCVCVCDMLLAFYNRITNRKVPFLSTLLRPPSTGSQVRIFGMRLGTKCVFNVPSCPPPTPQMLPALARSQRRTH